MNRVTRSLGVAALAAALLAAPVQAEEAPLELVQAGDGDKTCAALAAEINTLSEREAKAAKRAESSRKFLGFASTALQAAAPLLGSGKLGGGQGNMLAQQALGSFQAQAMQQQAMQQQMAQQAMQQQMQQAMQLQVQQQLAQAYGATPGASAVPEAMEPSQAPERSGSIAAQRVSHLRGIFAEKKC